MKPKQMMRQAGQDSKGSAHFRRRVLPPLPRRRQPKEGLLSKVVREDHMKVDVGGARAKEPSAPGVRGCNGE